MREHDARRGSSGRFGISFCYGLASMFFGALCFDIGAHLIKRCATNTADIVSPVPELRLAVERGQMLGSQKQEGMAVRPAETPATSLGL